MSGLHVTRLESYVSVKISSSGSTEVCRHMANSFSLSVSGTECLAGTYFCVYSAGLISLVITLTKPIHVGVIILHKRGSVLDALKNTF